MSRIEVENTQFKEFEQDKSVHHAAIDWSLAEQIEPASLLNKYGPQRTAQIAVSILKIHTIYKEIVPLDIANGLTSGIGNIYWDQNGTSSRIFALTERLEKAIELIKTLPDKNIVKLDNSIWNNWYSVLFLSFKAEDESLTKNRVKKLRKVIEEFELLLPDSALPKEKILLFAEQGKVKTEEKRKADFIAVGKAHYGFDDFDDAKKVFKDYVKRLPKLADLNRDDSEFLFREIIPGPENQAYVSTDLSMTDVVNIVLDYISIHFGITLQDYIKIDYKTAGEHSKEHPDNDPLLISFPCYYYPAKKKAVFSKNASIGFEMIQQVFHELAAHAVTDVYNTSKQTENGEISDSLCLHRSWPDQYEETIAILFEEISQTYAELLDLRGVEGKREHFQYLRAFADLNHNYYGVSIDTLKLKLEKYTDNAAQILNTVQEKPGMYFYGYMTTPEKTKKLINEKGISRGQIQSVLKKIVKSGNSWEQNIFQEFKNFPESSPYALDENELGTFWQSLIKLKGSIPQADLNDILDVSETRPGQVLRNKPVKFWIEMLKNLNGENAHPTILKKDIVKPSSALGKIIMLLEQKTQNNLVNNAQIPVLYENEKSHNPILWTNEILELVFFAQLCDVSKNLEVQEQLLTWVHNHIIELAKNNKSGNYINIPAYSIDSSIQSLATLRSTLSKIPWKDEVLEDSIAIKFEIETLEKSFDAIQTLDGVRTNQEKYKGFVEGKFRRSLNDIEILIDKLLVSSECIDPDSWQTYNQYGLERTKAFLNASEICLELGMPIEARLRLIDTGNFENPTGVAFGFANNTLYFQDEPKNMPAKDVALKMTEQELRSMDDAKLELLVYINAIYKIAKIKVCSDILDKKEIIIEGEKFRIEEDNILLSHFQAAAGYEMGLLLNEYKARINPQICTSKDLVLRLERFIEYKKSRYSLPEREATSLDDKSTVLVMDMGEESYDLDYLKGEYRYYQTSLTTLLKKIPADHQLSKIASDRKIIKKQSIADSSILLDAYTEFYTTISFGIWRSRISGDSVPQPLAPLIPAILCHENIHMLVESASLLLDPKKWNASSINYGPESEGIATFLAYKMIKKEDPELAKKYLTYNLYRARAEIGLNYGIKNDDGNIEYMSMASVVEFYSKYLPYAQAMYLARVHTAQYRSKPWSLSYIAEFDRWEEIYSVLDKNGHTEKQIYQLLIIFGSYSPVGILDLIESNPSLFSSLVE